MKKVMKRIILIMFIILIMVSVSIIRVNAAGNQYDRERFENKENPLDKLTGNTTDTVIGVVRVVCVTIAIVMLLVISIKYMISAPGDRADIKKHAIAYVIGAVILFGSSAILGVLVDISNQINP